MKTTGNSVLRLLGSVVLPLVLSVVLMSTQSIAAEPLQIRVLSYNIHHGAGVDGKLDLPRIAGVITAVKPDLVALQEVDRNTERAILITPGSRSQRPTYSLSLDQHAAPAPDSFLSMAVLTPMSQRVSFSTEF